MLKRDKAALLVIDFQEKLLPTISNHETIVPSTVKLIRFCKELGIPVLWTEQYPKGLGHTVHELKSELDGLAPIEKTEFGCTGNPDFDKALEQSGRSQLLVTGIEGHICVMQTVLNALDTQKEVYVATDAIGSSSVSQCEAGIERMAKHGAEMVTSQMAMFEILGKAGTPEFKQVMPLLK